MKRLPLFLSFIAVVALSASLAYWAVQLYKPAQRPIAATPLQLAPEASLEAAAGLFGGQPVALAVAASNYQLKGVVAAGNGRGSVAILSVDGKPPQAVPVGREIAAGVMLKEVFAKHIVLAEGGALKRIELAGDAGGKSEGPAAVAFQPPAQNPAPAAIPAPPQPQAPARMTAPPTMIVAPATPGADKAH